MSYFRHFVKGSKKFKNMSSGAGAAPKKDGSETSCYGCRMQVNPPPPLPPPGLC